MWFILNANARRLLLRIDEASRKILKESYKYDDILERSGMFTLPFSLLCLALSPSFCLRPLRACDCGQPTLKVRTEVCRALALLVALDTDIMDVCRPHLNKVVHT